jgi:hypothetical protein
MDRLLNHYKQSSTTNTYDRNPYGDENKLIWEKIAGEITRIAEGRDQEDNVIAANFRGA